MKNFNFLSLTLIGLLVAFSFLSVKAQDEMPSSDTSMQNNIRERRPKLVQQLDLTPEQMQQIRRINAEQKPLLRDAQIRLREANQNLDQAIYAENANETNIQARIKETQIAQAEVIKIRSTMELAIRRILTAEQLSKFRETRRKFVQNRNNRQKQRRNQKMDLQNRPADVPNRRIKNRERFPRSNS
ncbi:MAG: periplasmic heavy metal sensor [Acidobacteria bacterium]|nr:periplasmic heavy metal sensor [Acidobacteriota bacterium]MCA1640019.1 periplasmic heavy metal sensor [Acidobacteriota bacterium]